MQDADYEWDDDKAESNPRDHAGVTFDEARWVFLDPQHVEFFDDAHSEDAEDRYVAIGFSGKGHLLAVIFTPRPPRLRIISARPAEHEEELLYEQENRY